MFIEHHFDSIGKFKNNFSILYIIKEMGYGVLVLGLVTTVQTIGLVYFLYGKPNDENTVNDPTDEDLEILSQRKTELAEIYKKITTLQQDIQVLREKLEER